MQLDKKDLGQIKTIVGEIVQKSEDRIISVVEEIVQKSEDRVISVINREVSDLAQINRAVIEKVDTINILEKRVTRIEHKVGIIS